MKQTAAYFLTQLKRAARLLPGQILADIAVCFCAGAFACLLISQGALAAEGTSIVTNRHYIDRGYEDIVLHLRELGADIELA